MSKKFMKLRRILLPVMAAIILTSQLAGCATATSNEMLDLLNQGQDIEITMAVPDYGVNVLGEVQRLTDVELAQLTTYTDNNFRSDFDTLFGIKQLDLGGEATKSGCIYVDRFGSQDGNTSFVDSLRNKVFMEKYFNTDEIKSALSSLAEQAYADVEADSEYAINASLNAYYNLLNDNKQGSDEYFNATQSVSRGDFYSFVYRASNGVNNLLETQGDFATKVGSTNENIVYASQVDQHAWLNADNEGLRKGNYDSSISRAEAIYMLMNMNFSKELASMDISNVTLGDAKDGGGFLEDSIADKKISDQLYTTSKGNDDKIMAKGWQLGVISKMMKAEDGSVQTDLYKALALAEQLGVISGETRYNEPVSKAEAIELFISTMQAVNDRDGYIIEDEEGITPDIIIGDGIEDGIISEEELGYEMPPIDVMYSVGADTNKDGGISKTEWEAWVTAHPEDTNKDMQITSDELEVANGSSGDTQKPVETPPATTTPVTPPVEKPTETTKPVTPPATTTPKPVEPSVENSGSLDGVPSQTVEEIQQDLADQGLPGFRPSTDEELADMGVTSDENGFHYTPIF